MNHESGNMSKGDAWVPKAYADMPLVQRAHELALCVYRETSSFPKVEQYGLTSQIRRAAVSIPANICEGKGHHNDKELHRYLSIARASLSEVIYLAFLAKDLGYLSATSYTSIYSLADEVGRMSKGLQSYIRENVGRRSSPRS